MKEKVVSIIEVLKQYFADLFQGLKSPGPYLFFDIATILGEIFLFSMLSDNFTTLWLDTYFYVFIFFLISIFLKRWDKSYLKGLEWIKRPGVSRIGFYKVLFVYFLSPVIGGFAIASALKILNIEGTAPAYIGIPLFLISIIAYPLIFFIFADYRAKLENISNIGDSKLIQNFIRIVSGAGIYLLNLYFLSFIYFKADNLLSENMYWLLKPVALIAVLGIFILIYMPARIHYFIDEPQSRSNRAWFIFTVIFLVFYVLTGISFI